MPIKAIQIYNGSTIIMHHDQGLEVSSTQYIVYLYRILRGIEYFIKELYRYNSAFKITQLTFIFIFIIKHL